MDFGLHKRKRSEDVIPWTRSPDEFDTLYDYEEESEESDEKERDEFDEEEGEGRHTFYARHVRNKHLDIYTKKAALKASPSIVGLESETGKGELFHCTGTVMECDNKCSIILTSASLLRSSTLKKSVGEDIKITVHLPEGTSIDGQIETFDLHFNLAAIRIKCPLPVASFTHLNDAMSIHPIQLNKEMPFHLRHHHSRVSDLIPGDPVVALGRFIKEPYQLMAAPGKFSIGRCGFLDEHFNCKELLKASCRITRCGVGGPLINRCAEVIGICFYDLLYTAFLPINVATLWWEHYKKHRESRRPFVGIEATNLYTANLKILEKVIRIVPHARKGVLIEEVKPLSAADSVGIHRNDVIIECDGEWVQSSLELFERIWHKVGGHVELTVVRLSDKPRFVFLSRWSWTMQNLMISTGGHF